MPARLIRDGLLDSEAVLSLPVEARWVYVTILLTADDLGLFEATAFRLARKADIRRELADSMIEMLMARDLIRLYEVGGKTYGFIPRYGQRVQISRAKHPLPPEAMVQDDPVALSKIKHLGSKTTVDFGGSRKTTAGQPPEVEVEVEVERKATSSSLRSEEEAPPPAPKPKATKAKAPRPACPDDVDAQVWADWLELREGHKAPPTATVIKTARDEAAKASMPLEAFLRIWVMRGSRGLFAEWLKSSEMAQVKQAARTSSHSGFSKIDYKQGVTQDGYLA